MQTDGPKYSLNHWLVNLNNANKNGVNLPKYFKRLEHVIHAHGCEYCGILSEFSIIQSEVQATVVLL